MAHSNWKQGRHMLSSNHQTLQVVNGDACYQLQNWLFIRTSCVLKLILYFKIIFYGNREQWLTSLIAHCSLYKISKSSSTLSISWLLHRTKPAHQTQKTFTVKWCDSILMAVAPASKTPLKAPNRNSIPSPSSALFASDRSCVAAAVFDKISSPSSFTAEVLGIVPFSIFWSSVCNGLPSSKDA